MNETRTLAKFVAQSKYDDLPAKAVEHAKHLILDHFGVALFSSRTKWGQIAVNYAKEFSFKSDCTVYGQPWRTSAQHAAFANGLCAHGYELDDTHEGGGGHPGAPTIPAAVAIAEKEKKSGRDFILGVVMGYELIGRIGKALGREASKQHHSTGQIGVFGAAGAAAKIMGLPEEGIRNALGIAGAMASGVMEFAEDPEGTMIKRLYGGWPAQSGVVAATLARDGFTGPATIIEGRYGFLRSISTKFSLEPLTANLGQDYELLHTGFKPYASGRIFHPLIEAIDQLKREHGVTSEKVEKIIIGATEKMLNQHMVYEPKSMMSAQYSLPFTTALAIHRDLMDPINYSEDAIWDKAVVATSHKVEAVFDPEIDAGYPTRHSARVTVRLVGGKEVTATVWDPRGSSAKPLTYEELTGKFRNVTRRIFSDGHIDRIIAEVEKLDKAGSVESLCSVLRGK